MPPRDGKTTALSSRDERLHQQQGTLAEAQEILASNMRIQQDRVQLKHLGKGKSNVTLASGAPLKPSAASAVDALRDAADRTAKSIGFPESGWGGVGTQLPSPHSPASSDSQGRGTLSPTATPLIGGARAATALLQPR